MGELEADSSASGRGDEVIAPQFVCLSMCVSGAPWRRHPMPLSVLDCLAYAIERESEAPEWPPLVARALTIFPTPSQAAETTAEITRLKDRNRALERAIAEHNKRCAKLCCGDTTTDGLVGCATCPRRYMIGLEGGRP